MQMSKDMLKVKKEDYCRVCGGPLHDRYDLGSMYPSDFISEEPRTEPVPLVLSECTHCSLIQLRHTISMDFMYKKYWYRSALNKSMVSDLNG